MNKRLLTLDDLYKFYSTKKKSMKFNADKEGYNLSVQVKGKFEVVDENEEGLMFVKIKAFHDLGNLNKSYIDTDTLKTKMYSINNRPILADIVEIEDEYGNKVKDFSGHSMKINEEEDRIEYIEFPVGHFINPDNITLEYDEEYDRNFVYCDAVIYEEYTDTCDILRRRGGTDVSIELVIRDLMFDCKSKLLKLNDFYVQGCTLLGANIRPGMAGSKLTLKDFAESNNSMFSDMTEDEHTKLVDTLEKLNKTLENISKFNIDKPTENEEGGVNVKKEFENNENEIVVENESEVIETEKCKPKKKNEAEGAESGETVDGENTNTETFDDGGDSGDISEGSGSDDSAESANNTANTTTEDTSTEDGTNVEDPVAAEPEVQAKEDNLEDPEDEDENEKNEDDDKKKQPFSKTFELSHSDIRSGLYSLLSEFELTDNDWYWIAEVYDNYFIYQSSCTGAYWGQNYTKDGDNVAFDGERYEMFNEFLTKSEKENLESMRSNYSSIQEELNTYKEAELNSQREAVFNDEAYAEFVDTASFKEIKEKINTYSLDELRTACDLAFAKEVKSKGAFALNKDSEKKEEKKASFFMFSKQEQNTSFLDSLLNK